jgi:hypothetical protein
MNKSIVAEPLPIDTNNNDEHADQNVHIEEPPLQRGFLAIPGVSSSFLIPDEEIE